MAKLRINPVVRILIVTDFFYNAAQGIFAPIFAVFIVEGINGGSVEVAGFAVSVYWLVKSPIQLFVARLLDKLDGQADFWAVFFGYLCSGFLLFGYLFATEAWQLYLIAGLNGLCMSWAVPAWYRIFTRHIDKWEIGFEWSLDSAFSVGLATASAAAAGGYLAKNFGFGTVFILAGSLGVISATGLLLMRSHLRPSKSPARALPERHLHHR